MTTAATPPPIWTNFKYTLRAFDGKLALTALSKKMGKLSLIICEGFEQLRMIPRRPETYNVTEQQDLINRRDCSNQIVLVQHKKTYDKNPMTSFLQQPQHWTAPHTSDKTIHPQKLGVRQLTSLSILLLRRIIGRRRQYAQMKFIKTHKAKSKAEWGEAVNIRQERPLSRWHKWKKKTNIPSKDPSSKHKCNTYEKVRPESHGTWFFLRNIAMSKDMGVVECDAVPVWAREGVGAVEPRECAI